VTRSLDQSPAYALQMQGNGSYIRPAIVQQPFPEPCYGGSYIAPCYPFLVGTTIEEELLVFSLLFTLPFSILKSLWRLYTCIKRSKYKVITR
jgi:hypothetical protein